MQIVEDGDKNQYWIKNHTVYLRLIRPQVLRRISGRQLKRGQKEYILLQ